MPDAVIGALRVVIGADTGVLEENLKRTQSRLDQWGRDITKIVAGIQLDRIIVQSFRQISNAIADAVSHADDMGKMAQKVGLSVEEFTKLSFAANLSDVSLESLSTGLGKLSKNMAEAVSGNQKIIAQF